jgi:hypothetical protein
MTYLESGDAARSLTDYYPSWLDNLADDVTIEGSAMDGVARAAEAVRTILVTIRMLYESQKFQFVGPVGGNGLLEDNTAQVRGEPISCVVLVTRSPAPPMPSTSPPASTGPSRSCPPVPTFRTAACPPGCMPGTGFRPLRDHARSKQYH